jgi:phosphatidylethanolamine-binding protein (PEBP) family uncharacterized protein
MNTLTSEGLPPSLTQPGRKTLLGWSRGWQPLGAGLVLVIAGCGGGGSSTSSTIQTTTPAAGAFTRSSAAASSAGELSAAYTCDGAGSSPALSWTQAPAGTQEFAVLMSTLPGDGSVKYNWVLHGIPASRSSLARDNFGIGTLGSGSDGPAASYQAPCSQGPGAKTYTLTIYALSAAPVLSGVATGAQLASAIASLTLGKASLDMSYSRTSTSPGNGSACKLVRDSLSSSTTGNAQANCDADYAYISSNGLATHAMMNGITATNLQVPTAQAFLGTNAWRIPLTPVPASSPVSATDGPIGVAINGVPIFNPCKQGGCQNGDTKALGELDQCNGHAGRADDYHYHAAPVCLMAGKPTSYWDTRPLGWALDGYGIFGYNGPDGRTAARDGNCGGNTGSVSNAPAGYSYHVTDTSPYVLSCFYGQPSPDLAGQAAKYSPIRTPPVTPFSVSAMSLSSDANTGQQVLQWTSANSFTTSDGSSYNNPAGTYQIRYVALSGAALESALSSRAGKTACWRFEFTNSIQVSSQPTAVYCR